MTKNHHFHYYHNMSNSENTCYLVALISNRKYVRPEIKRLPLFSLSSKKKRKERKKTRFFCFFWKEICLILMSHSPYVPSFYALPELTLHCMLRLLCPSLITGPFYIISHEPLKHDHWWEAPSTTILGGNRQICDTVLNKNNVYILLSSGFFKVS